MRKILSLLTVLFTVAIFAQGYTPIRGAGIEARATQQGLVCIACNSSELNNVVDADLNNYANVGNLISAFGGNGISVKNTLGSYPAGYITGFNIDMNNSFLTLAILNSLEISTYKDGVKQESSTSSTLVSVPAFGGSKSGIFIHLPTTKSFDEVRIYQKTGIAGFNSMNVYYAFAFDPNSVPTEDNGICDDLIGGSNFDTNISSSGNFISPLSYISNKERITDGDKNSAADLIMPAGLLGSYSVGVLDKNAIYPAGNNAGFVISPNDQNTILSAQVLNNLTVETYLFGKLQDSQSYGSGGGLINISVLSFGSNKQKLSVKTTKPFNEVRLKVSQPLGINIGALKVYYAFEEPQGCDCKQYLLTSSNGALSGSIVTGSYGGGLFGIGAKPWTGVYNTILSSLTNTHRVVDDNLDNAATFTSTPFSLNATMNLTVKNNGTLFPAGTFGGFTIDKGATLFDVGVLNSVIVSFYNGTTLTETKTGSSGLFSGRFITSNSGKMVVGFKATKPFNRMMVTITNGFSINTFQTYNIYNAFIEGDVDGDGVPDCYDMCPGGNDNMDSDGDGIPDDCDSDCDGKDKSPMIDSDGDGTENSCDLDSDNDGIPDEFENYGDLNQFEDDDNEGSYDIYENLGDGIANYLDLDSDNDGILDLHESGIPIEIIQQIDQDMNGIIDENVEFGNNGLADVLETYPDSGILNYTIKDSDGDGTPDFLDVTSNGVDFDLYLIGRGDLDDYGYGFISVVVETDMDGIMDTIDNDIIERGSPNSMIPAVKTFDKTVPVIEDTFALQIYPNPVPAGNTLNIKSTGENELSYIIYSIQGAVIRSGVLQGKSEIQTSGMNPGIYILKVQDEITIKTYKIILK